MNKAEGPKNTCKSSACNTITEGLFTMPIGPIFIGKTVFPKLTRPWCHGIVSLVIVLRTPVRPAT